MQWLSAKLSKPGGTVDREAKVLRGYVVAQEGDFKSEGRGTFNAKSLESLAGLMNAKSGGVKSRFMHPTASDDGLGKFLGRAKNARLDNVGDMLAIRADLHFNETAFSTPNGNLAGYVMDLAESDPDAISSSVVIKADQFDQLDAKGRPLQNEAGIPKPPLWMPTEIHASDIVDTGDAVDGLLSHGITFEGLPDEITRRAVELFRVQFFGRPREYAEAHILDWSRRLLHLVYGDPPATMSRDVAEALYRLAKGRTQI